MNYHRFTERIDNYIKLNTDSPYADKMAIERLAELEDKIEDGRLKEFPCKVGDVVWFIKTTGFKPELIKTTVEKLVVKNGVYLKLACNSFYETSANSIGKSIFFDNTKAEKKLKELKGEE